MHADPAANNAATALARSYHTATTHTPLSVRQGSQRLDWANQPAPYKDYLDLPALPLPTLPAPGGPPALETIAAVAPAGRGALDRAALARLLFYAGGVTRRLRLGATLHDFRAASSAGALYPVELYVAAGPLADLDAGVYHFSPRDFALRQLRAGDFRATLAEATGDAPGVREAAAVLAASAIFWRSAWKYRARAYRYCFWDCGTLLANLLAEAAALDLPARLLLGFAYDAVNHLLGLDGAREAALALVTLGRGAPAPAAAPAPPLAPRVAALSRREVAHPEIAALHGASCLADGAAAAAWRASAAPSLVSPPAGAVAPLPPDADPPRDALEQVIRRRGSSRQFAPVALPAGSLGTLLDRATRGLPADFVAAPPARLNELFLITSAVEGLAPGAYRWADGGLESLRTGDFRQSAGYLCLDQELAAEAGAVVFFLSDLGAVLARLGNRGYRAAQLEAGLIGGRLYLGAYAYPRLGATGLTFYDEEVVRFFGPRVAGLDAIFVVALGVDARRARRSGGR
ncbi:MAG: SagB family peptide dehydrogenase [Chloroflexi bacterium]|nr:SagB family peptide dehydrogenase [Chloroflexota bacterium]